MNRRLLVLALMAVSLCAFAQDPILVFEKPFRPMSPVVVGQGGSFTANASGWDAFFGNPAGMAGKGSVTLMSVNPWVYTRGDMAAFVLNAIQHPESLTGTSEPSASVVGRAVTVNWPVAPPAWLELPEGVTWDDFLAAVRPAVDAALTGLVDELKAQFDPSGEFFPEDITINIPESWLALDPATFEDMQGLEDLAPYLEDFLDANSELLDTLSAAMAANYLPEGFPAAPKLRVGFSAGLGLIVKGFGLGFATIFDADVEGSSILTTTGDATLTVGFMAGYAHQFRFTDNLSLKVGGLLRPMFRINAPLKLTGLFDAMGSMGGSFDAMGLLDTMLGSYGTALGIDVGAILGIGPFSIGLSVNDLFDTRFNYRSSGLRELYETLVATQRLPAGTELADEKHVIPMDMRLGASFHPDLGRLSFIIDPTIHAQVGNFLTVAREAKAARDARRDYPVAVGDIVAFGAELRLLRVLALRAGYYQGAISAGIGAHLLFLDANVAAYIAPGTGSSLTTETQLGQLGDIGVAFELALRF